MMYMTQQRIEREEHRGGGGEKGGCSDGPPADAGTASFKAPGSTSAGPFSVFCPGFSSVFLSVLPL